MTQVHFWFDYISHNAYLAWHGLDKLAADFELEIVSEPVVFAGLLNHYGNKGPAELPAKSQWMLKNVLRKARRAGIPIQPPASHPFNPLLSLRATLALDDREQRNAFVSRMFTAVWAQSMSPSSIETIRQCAIDVGVDAEQLLQLAEDPDTKDALHDQTRAAINAGVFGVPSMFVNDDLYWGYDDLEFLQAHLDAKPDVPAPEIRQWQSVRPSAKR
ncbi:MAG: 2-hydroxychromene-2-carboxylate isomerase [Oceanococcus sp.]